MKKGLTLAFALLAMAFAMAQKSQDPVLFEIGGEQIRQSEFMKEFLRSIGKDPAAAPTACTYEKRKALEDYVQLFVNYRTKLHDAYALGMDTAAALRKELASYRNELAAPYLIDSATMASLVDEAYQRNHYAVHAAHILLPLKASASPDDTLRIYNEALSVYNRVTTGKENFFSVAREIMDKKLSPEEKERMGQVAPGHEGDLGFFTVFDMIYPFENTAYTLEVGAVSKPVRTRYGYHIIKVIDRVPYYGSTHLRHIWISKGNSKAEGHPAVSCDVCRFRPVGSNGNQIPNDQPDADIRHHAQNHRHSGQEKPQKGQLPVTARIVQQHFQIALFLFFLRSHVSSPSWQKPAPESLFRG